MLKRSWQDGNGFTTMRPEPAEQGRISLVRNPADRRKRRRYSLRLAVKCRRIEPRPLLNSIVAGRILDISSNGLLFTTREAFKPGQIVEAFIDWPIRLHDGARLTLVVEGPVVRSAGNRAAMQIEKYQFRTCAAGGPALR
jgi:hypothetical protein